MSRGLMSTDTSVPQPRMSGLDMSDSALLATLLREAPIGFAFFGTDLRFRRINRSLARLHDRNGSDYLGLLPSQVWPDPLASQAETAIRHVLADDQPLFEPDQAIAGLPAGRRRPCWQRCPADRWVDEDGPQHRQDRPGPGRREPALGVLVVPLARPRRGYLRGRPDRGGRYRAAQLRGGGPPQRGALPVAGPGGRAGRLGDHADRRRSRRTRRTGA